MTKKDFKKKINDIILAETPEIKSDLIDELYKRTVTNNVKTISRLSHMITEINRLAGKFDD